MDNTYSANLVLISTQGTELLLPLVSFFPELSTSDSLLNSFISLRICMSKT